MARYLRIKSNSAQERAVAIRKVLIMQHKHVGCSRGEVGIDFVASDGQSSHFVNIFRNFLD
ncbi:MAG: hypothetical protein DI630_27705 [Gordonia sp. (in: high G+C Gram-positive bacteria)]|nr:MAG: hypothetical protein DI630_27705 [Gordonia sp. (in: high G+C Gram-positive bacteria)]